jgi:hypothetical protein
LSSLIGALVLVGGAFDVAALRSILPGAVAMKTNTALGLLLSGLSLWLLSDKEAAGGRKYLGQGCAAAIFLIGALTLSQYLFGWRRRCKARPRRRAPA